jgi:hypothetical protein
LQSTRVIGCGGGAVAIAVVAIGSKAAADVRTGHITNHTAGDESYRSTEKRSGSRPKGHVVYPLSSVSRRRQEKRGGDDCLGQKAATTRFQIFFQAREATTSSTRHGRAVGAAPRRRQRKQPQQPRHRCQPRAPRAPQAEH